MAHSIKYGASFDEKMGSGGSDRNSSTAAQAIGVTLAKIHAKTSGIPTQRQAGEVRAEEETVEELKDPHNSHGKKLPRR